MLLPLLEISPPGSNSFLPEILYTNGKSVDAEKERPFFQFFSQTDCHKVYRRVYTCARRKTTPYSMKKKEKKGNTITMNRNTEMNINEMEMIAGGSQTTDRMLSRGGKGAAAGAAVGAAAGTVFPIVGTAAGALIGTTVGFIGGLASGLLDP